MQWTVANSNNAEKEIAAADYPNIRLFAVPLVSVPEPKKDVAARWTPCTPETVAPFSAVAYYFGRKLHEELDVPVGLIRTCWGGSACEAWVEKAVLESDERYQAILDRVEKANPQHKAYHLYNGMIAPLIPYGIRGAIWYQGESNAGRAYQYRTLFPTMIENWRANWGEGDFPFYFVQLANFRQRKDEPDESAWAELREAQSLTLSLPNTGQAVTIDIGEADDIHPRNKQDVGRRLARWALAKDYGKDIVYSGPAYRSMKRVGNKIVLQFDHVGGGLIAKGDTLEGFAIAGEDRQFVWADATIEGDTVVVSSPSVEEPVAVRYGWADNPAANLYNQAGLPASPFRTDSWPGITASKQ
jgi:sialate O-acetylesterase